MQRRLRVDEVLSDLSVVSAGRATAGCATEMNTENSVTLGEGAPGSRSLEIRLMSDKTIILSADSQKRVHDVLHQLPGAD